MPPGNVLMPTGRPAAADARYGVAPSGPAAGAGAADAAAEAARSADPRMNPRAFKLRISYPGFDFHPDFGLR